MRNLKSCSVQSLSRVLLLATPWTTPRLVSLSFGISEFAQTHVHWVSDTIQPSHPVSPLSSCPQYFPASGSFPMSWLFTSGGQSIGTSASASVLPINIQSWFPLGLTLVWSPCCPMDSQESSPAPQVQKQQFFGTQPSFGPTLTSIHDYWKNHTFGYMDLCWQSYFLLFNMLSRFVMAFLPMNRHLLISWLQSLSILILEPKKIKSVTISTISPSIPHEVMELDAMFFIYGIFRFRPVFSLLCHLYQEAI